MIGAPLLKPISSIRHERTATGALGFWVTDRTSKSGAVFGFQFPTMADAHHGRQLRRLAHDLHNPVDVYHAERSLITLSDLLRNPLNLRPSFEIGIPKALVGLLGHTEPSIRQKTTELLSHYSGGVASSRHESNAGDLRHYKVELQEMATNMSVALGHAQKPDLAVTAAIEALKFASEVHGHGHIELVQSILLLAEKNIDLKALNKAETCLTQASYIVGKTPDTSSELKAKLYRVLGRLYTARGNSPLALRFLADDVYFSSMAHGPEDIRTTGGYFLMAGVFLSSGHAHDASKAEVLHDTIERIWRSFIGGILQRQDGTTFLTESEAVEARNHLIQIEAERAKASDTLRLAQARGTLGMLLAACGQLEDALDVLDKSKLLVDGQDGNEAVIADIVTTIKTIEMMREQQSESLAATSPQP